MRSRRETEHTFDFVAGRENGASQADPDHCGSDATVFHPSQGSRGHRGGDAFAMVSVLLEELGHQVTVVNARRVKLISQSDSKSDQIDSELLARLGKADVKLLAPIRHRSMEAQSDLAVPKARDGLVGCRTKLINTCRGLVKSFGRRLPKCSAQTFHVKAREHVPAVLKPALEPIFQALERIHKAIQKEDQLIERLAKKYPDVELLSQPNGVGVLTALVYLLTLEDKNRFRSSRMVGAHLGLRPRKSQSGEDDPQLR